MLDSYQAGPARPVVGVKAVMHDLLLRARIVYSTDYSECNCEFFIRIRPLRLQDSVQAPTMATIRVTTATTPESTESVQERSL